MRMVRWVRVLAISVLAQLWIGVWGHPASAMAVIPDQTGLAGEVGPHYVAPQQTRPAWRTKGKQSGAFYGNSVASAGDVNGDGYDDVIVGADGQDHGQTDDGAAFLYLGSAMGLSTTPDWTAEGNQDSANFGNSVASAGDVNGDGYDDVIVGAYLYDNGQVDEGAAFLYLGSATGLSTTAAWRGAGNQRSALFGYSVASAGDVNGDGYGDVVVGVYSYTDDQQDQGAAFLYLGSPAGLSTTPAWKAEGNQDFIYFGNSVASAGDVNGDGFDDVIVGAEFWKNGQAQEGAAFLFLGSPSGLSATPAWSGEGDQELAHYGYSVASAGDVNGDGYDDVIVGAYQYDDGQFDEGKAFLYLGSPTGLSTTEAWTREGNQIAANYGNSVASAGDVNRDGYDDVIVGADLLNHQPVDEGVAFLYLGSPTGLSTKAAWKGEGNWGSADFGNSVASAGDVNGDGYDDVIVGAYVFRFKGAAFVYQVAGMKKATANPFASVVGPQSAFQS